MNLSFSGTFLGFGIALMMTSQYVRAQRASDSDMAASALSAAFRASSHRTIEERRAAADERLTIRSVNAANPGATFLGTVVFATGLSSGDLEGLAKQLGFEVAGADAKVAVGQKGEVITLGVGARDLAILSDFELSKRLWLATGNLIFRRYQSELATSPEPERQSLMKDLADPGPLYYEATIVADIKTFAKLRAEKTVAAVMVDETRDGAIRYQDLVQKIAHERRGAPFMTTHPVEENVPPQRLPAREHP